MYDTIEHPALGRSPRDTYAGGLADAGERAHRLISYNEEFKILTLPTTSKATAKVVPGRGVKINYIYYFCEAFRDPKVEGEQVEVRYEPFDIGRSYAHVRGQWVECYSEHYSILRNHSELELMIAAEELRRRRTLHTKSFNVTAAKLASFFESVEAEEVLLQQRTIDRESHALYAVMPREPEQQAPTEKPHDPTTRKIYEEF